MAETDETASSSLLLVSGVALSLGLLSAGDWQLMTKPALQRDHREGGAYGSEPDSIYLPLALHQLSPSPNPTATATPRRSLFWVDELRPQPYQGQAVYSTIASKGDRCTIYNSAVSWGNGQVTTTIASGTSWGGVWMSLNHPLREGLALDFSAICRPRSVPRTRSRITSLTAHVARGTPGRTIRLELKDAPSCAWKGRPPAWRATGLSFELARLGKITHSFGFSIMHPGGYVVLDNISLRNGTDPPIQQRLHLCGATPCC